MLSPTLQAAPTWACDFVWDHTWYQTTMHAASVALIVTALLNACVWLGLLRQLWVLRHSFEIAARAPVLVGISAGASLIVLSAIFAHWILLYEAKGLPCYGMLLVTYFCFAAFMVPYCLRALQLVVAYNTRYRLKYARYVKGNNVFKTSVGIGTAIAVAAFLVWYNMPERYGRGMYGCFFFNERRAIEGAIILGMGPTIFAVFELRKVQDVFGIGREIVRVVIPLVVCAVTEMIVQELLHANIIDDSRAVHLWMEFMPFGVLFNILFCRYYGWHGAGKMFVVPLEGQASQFVDEKEGIYDYAQEGGKVAEMFGEFCRHSLCMESWEFIMESMAYKKLADPHEQFECFIRIVDQYLRPTSPQEVNVGCKMQRRLLSFQTIDTFTSLDKVTRDTVLEEPVGEIVLMLEQNVLAKFKHSPAMQQLKKMKLVEKEFLSAQRVADGDAGILEVMASVSIGRMISPMTRGGADGHRRSIRAGPSTTSRPSSA